MPTYPTELLAPHDLQHATALYNGMIHPLKPLGIRGAIGTRANPILAMERSTANA